MPAKKADTHGLTPVVLCLFLIEELVNVNR